MVFQGFISPSSRGSFVLVVKKSKALTALLVMPTLTPLKKICPLHQRLNFLLDLLIEYRIQTSNKTKNYSVFMPSPRCFRIIWQAWILHITQIAKVPSVPRFWEQLTAISVKRWRRENFGKKWTTNKALPTVSTRELVRTRAQSI